MSSACCCGVVTPQIRQSTLAAAACGGDAVPAVAGQEDRGMGRRDGEGCSAVSGRAAAVSRLARGRRAACASGE